jgi:hypothetical protein
MIRNLVGPILAALLASPAGVAAQRPLPTRSAFEALAEDAGIYAARYRVSPAEAMRRLRLQEQSVPLTDALAAEFSDRLAGIYLEHAPTFRIVVLLTGDTPEPIRIVAIGGSALPVVFRTGATATRAQILDAIGEHQAEIREALIDPPGLGVDPRSGALWLAVGGRDADRAGLPALEQKIAALAGVPVHALVPGREANLAALAGGEVVESIDPARHKRYLCTAGFVVTDGTRTGIATAAHCPDQLTQIDVAGARVPLEMVGAWGARYQDVQIHTAAASLAPLFHAGADPAALRAVTSWRNRASTRAGDFVCHQGEASGYSCAEVLLPDYAPPGDLCAGPCPATWVAVAGPQCLHGDSGGPVFLGATAFGLVKSGSYEPDGRCDYYVYMSTDMLPPGWSLLH